MESALRRGTAPIDPKDAGREEGRGGDAQIVVVRPRVVESVGHVLGNLFQRIYHLIEQVGESDAVAAAQLETNTRYLEDFLQLVIDYFSPLTLALQPVPAAEIIQSLARQISDTTGGSVKVDVQLSSDGRLLVDAGRLARGFALLAGQLSGLVGGDEGIGVRVNDRPAGRSLHISVQVPRRLLAVRSSAAEIQWAVAEKVIEIHGGALREEPADSGGVLWQIALPLQS